MFPFIWLKSCIFFMQLYVELTGDEKQEKNIPKDVHLQIRHLSASYFRAGDNSIKDYRQPLGSYRKIEFNRFATTDQKKCEESTAREYSGLQVVFRSFLAAALKLWNGLPVELRQATSLNSFKSRLKTYLFKKYFYSL